MQMYNQTLFPYEEKELKEAYNKIPYDEVINRKDNKSKQIIVIYHNNKFYQISLERYLEGKHMALKPYQNYLGTHIYDYYEGLDDLIEVKEDIHKKPDYIFGLNEYEKNHLGDGYKQYIERYRYDNNPYRRLRYALRYLENPFIKIMAKKGYCALVNNIVTKEINDPSQGFFKKYKNEKSIDAIRVFDEKLNEYIKNNIYDYQVYEQLIELYKIRRFNITKLEKILTFCQSGKSIENLIYLLKNNREYNIDSLYDYYLRCNTFQAIPPEHAHRLLSDYIKTCECIAIKPDYYPNSLNKVHKVIRKIYNQTLKERNVLKIDKTYDYQDDNYIIKQAIDEEKFDKLKNIFGYEYIRFNNNYYYLYSTKDKNKELAIINTTDNKEAIEASGIYTYKPYINNERRINARKISKAERQFIKKWLNKNKQLNLKN